MSTSLEEFLNSQDISHHGVKGMKWGKRNDKGHEGQAARTSKINKLDKKFEKKADSTKTTLAVYNHAAGKMNGGVIDRLNNKYPTADVTKDTPVTRKYVQEYQNEFMKALNEGASSLGTNASGTKSYEVVNNGDSWTIRTKDIQHEDGDLVVHLLIDDDGKIVGFETDDELEHYGTKGMRWGKRKAEDSAPSARQVRREQYKSDLKSGREAAKAKRELTPDQAKALRTNANRKILALMATYGAAQVASYYGGKAIDGAMAKRMSAAATAGAQANNANLKQIGDLSTFVLRKGANGSWG